MLHGRVEEPAGEIGREATRVGEDLAEVRSAQRVRAAGRTASRAHEIVAARESTRCAQDLHQRPARETAAEVLHGLRP